MMHTDCHSEVIRQLFQLLLLRCTTVDVHEDVQRCDQVACKFLKSSQLEERLRLDLETSLVNAIPTLLNDVLGGDSMRFSDCGALFRRIEACKDSFTRRPDGSGLPSCRSIQGTEGMGEGWDPSEREHGGVCRWHC